MADDTTSAQPRMAGLAHALWVAVGPAAASLREPDAPSVPYTSQQRAGIPPLCDVYLPVTGAAPHPSVVLVHGGGFLVGHRRMKPVRLLASRLAEAGFAVCAIDYRLLGRGGGLAEALEDVDLAAQFWRSQLSRYHCDPRRVCILGLSAGAALTLLHTGQSALDYARVVAFYPPASFDGLSGRRASFYLRFLMGSRDRDQWRARSPLAHALVPSPLLLIHGMADQLVPPAHSERIYEARHARGLPTELERVPAMQHGWLNDATLPETELAVQRVLRFLS